MTKLKRDAYYQKYFPNGTGEGESSEYHMLKIWLNDDVVTREDLLKAGFVEGGVDDYGDQCDFFVDEEDYLSIPPFSVPINGDAGIKQEDLPEGVKLLPEDWEDSVPELIGLKPEWVDAVTMDG